MKIVVKMVLVVIVVWLVWPSERVGSVEPSGELWPQAGVIPTRGANEIRSRHVAGTEITAGAVAPTHDPGDLIADLAITTNIDQRAAEDLAATATSMHYAALTGHQQDRYPGLADGNDTCCFQALRFTAIEIRAGSDDSNGVAVVLTWSGRQANGDTATGTSQSFWFNRGDTWISEASLPGM